jgi:hypothetical protein
MRLRTATSGALTLTAATAAALGAAAPVSPAPPTHEVRLADCDRVARAATFVGSMRAVRRTQRMWMRFTLFERVRPAEEYAAVSSPGLGVWRKSRPGVRRFSYRQRVRALAVAADYRAAVEFRWYDADGALLRQASARSRRCRQPGRLPNLRVRNIGYRPGPGVYVVRVANVGRGAAHGADVQLFVDGQEAGVRTLPDIRPGDVETAEITGPRCSGFVQAVADPSARVREWAEDDNALTEPCPQASS